VSGELDGRPAFSEAGEIDGDRHLITAEARRVVAAQVQRAMETSE